MNSQTGGATEAKPEDMTNISFIDPEWLRMWGLGPQNVYYYFKISPFYDPKCCNAQLEQQGYNPLEMPAKLQDMKGVQYLLVNLPPETPAHTDAGGVPPNSVPTAQHLHVIKKVQRHSRNNMDTLALYYIMDGVVYQSPSVYALIRSRIAKFAFHLNNGLSELAKLPEVSARGGYEWPWIREARLKQQEQTTKSTEDSVSAGVVDKILLDLVADHEREVAKRETSSMEVESPPEGEPSAPSL